jgi:hypothetical protein
LIVNRLACISPQHCAGRAGESDDQSKALRNISLAHVRDGSGDGDEEHRNESRANRRVSGNVKPGRQDRDGNPGAASANKTNQESDAERNRGELADDQEIL